LFSTYKEADNKYLYIGNSSTFKVPGIGKVITKMAYEKLLTLNNVLHIANKNKVENQLNKKIKATRSNNEEIMNHHLVNSVSKIVLSTKLPLFIHLNRMVTLNIII
jgi:cytidylate kinase